MTRRPPSFAIFLWSIPLVLVWSLPLKAAEMPSWLKASPRLAGAYPVYGTIGAGFGLFDRLEVNLGLGGTPESFAGVWAKNTADQSGRPESERAVTDVFRNNSLFRLGGRFYFSGIRGGLFLGAGTSRVQSRGQTDLASTLEPATATDFALLRNVLGSAGRPAVIDLSSTIDILDATAGYRFEVATNFFLDFEMGAAKIYMADLRLNSGMANYENSQYGQGQLRGAEADLESQMVAAPIAPSAGLSLSWFF